MIANTALVSIHGLIPANMLADGRTANSTVKVCIDKLMVLRGEECGKMGNALSGWMSERQHHILTNSFIHFLSLT